MRKVMIVLSGGQDSTTAAFYAKARSKEQPIELHAVTFNYGQRHMREIDAAVRIAGLLRVASHEVIDLGPGILESTSPLVSNQALETYQDFEQMDKVIGDRVEKTFVPMRNTLFMTIAANRAVARGCSDIFTGVCQADNANYPDCTLNWVTHMQTAINESLGKNGMFEPPFIRICAPLLFMSKAQSIALAIQMPGAYNALAWTHTAYDGAYPPVGKDHASVLRAYGFEEAGVPDPLVVRAVYGELMPVPPTPNYAKLRALFDESDHFAGFKNFPELLAHLVPEALR